MKQNETIAALIDAACGIHRMSGRGQSSPVRMRSWPTNSAETSPPGRVFPARCGFTFLVLFATLGASIFGSAGCREDAILYDFDGDGVPDASDCKPTDAAIYPGAEEVCDDGVDNDCDGVVDCGDDDDTAAATACDLGDLYVGPWGLAFACMPHTEVPFLMGSPVEEYGRDPNETQHEVTLSHDFWIGRYEVTQIQFDNAPGFDYHASILFEGCDECPATNLSWHEAVAFANAASTHAGLDACYTCDGSGSEVDCDLRTDLADPYGCEGYRLPTEAEWEYAARSHGTNPDAFPGRGNLMSDADGGECDAAIVLDDGSSLSFQSRYCYNSVDTIWPVGDRGYIEDTRDPTADSVYDMAGNVWEWTGDGWDGSDYLHEGATNPAGFDSASARVHRGGSCGASPLWVRAATRTGDPPSARSDLLGLRLARSLP